MLPTPATATVPLPRKLPRPFAKKPRPYLAVLRDAEQHPDAPEHHRRAVRAMTVDAIRATAIDAELVHEAPALEACCVEVL